jgi:hypothetical protein
LGNSVALVESGDPLAIITDPDGAIFGERKAPGIDEVLFAVKCLAGLV